MSKLTVNYKRKEYTVTSSLKIEEQQNLELENWISVEATNILKELPNFKIGDSFSCLLVDEESRKIARIVNSTVAAGHGALIIDTLDK